MSGGGGSCGGGDDDENDSVHVYKPRCRAGGAVNHSSSDGENHD